MLGIEFPLLAFSHCRDVVVEGQPEVEAAFMIPLGSDTDETPLALQNDVDEDAAESTGDAPD